MRSAARTPHNGQMQALGAVLVSALFVVVSAHIPPEAGARSLDALGYVLVAVAGASMVACVRWPRTVTAVTTVVLSLFVARNYPHGPVWATGWFTLGALSWRTNRRAALLGSLGLLA